MSCTCHLGHPPCGYCVEGTEEFQNAIGFIECLDDHEVERVFDFVRDLQEEREKAELARKVALGLPMPTPPEPIARTTPQPHPVAGIKAAVAWNVKLLKASRALGHAMRHPQIKNPWKAYDDADRSLWVKSIIGPNGDGARWDNRRRRGA